MKAKAGMNGREKETKNPRKAKGGENPKKFTSQCLTTTITMKRDSRHKREAGAEGGRAGWCKRERERERKELFRYFSYVSRGVGDGRVYGLFPFRTRQYGTSCRISGHTMTRMACGKDGGINMRPGWKAGRDTDRLWET